MDREKIESVIESLLFAAGEPVSLKKLCDYISEAPRADVRAALEELVRKCEHEKRGVRVLEVAGGHQLQTPPDNSPWVGKLLQQRPIRLSRPALETLAIVAYRQPVSKSEIEEIRGVDSGGVLKTLLDYGFLRIAGRKDVPGKPLIYATDKRFMEFFRLKSLAELPTLRELEEIQEQRLADGQGELPLGEEEPAAEEKPAAEGAGTDAESTEVPGGDVETAGEETEAHAEENAREAKTDFDDDGGEGIEEEPGEAPDEWPEEEEPDEGLEEDEE